MTHKALLTWAYDGSGVALRVAVHCWARRHGQALVTVSTKDLEILRTLEREHDPVMIGCDEYEMWVPARLLDPVGSFPAAESWNWND